MLLILKKNVFVDLLKVLCALDSVPPGPNGKIQAFNQASCRSRFLAQKCKHVMCVHKLCVLLQDAKLKAFLLIFKIWGSGVFH